MFVWDVQVIIDLSSLNRDLLMHCQISIKLCMLLALITLSRTSVVHNKNAFCFHKLNKTWKKRKAQSLMTVYSFDADEKSRR